MLVVLIIGILLGTSRRSSSELANGLRIARPVEPFTGLAAAMTHWAEAGDYDGFDTATAETIEPGFDWQTSRDSANGNQITIQAPDTGDPVTELLLVVRSTVARSSAWDKR